MFNRQNVREFRSDFQLAVAKLEEQYGVNISLGTISFDESMIKSKMTARKGEKAVELTKDDFKVGDMVGINYKKINPNDTFTIYKINNKNIKVEGANGELFTVSPSLLVKKTFKVI
jgi:hypothetical protein